MKSKPPHIEDYAKNDCSLQYIRRASIQEFKNVLESTLYKTIETGFGVSHLDDKVIKETQNPIRSLITIKTPRSNIEIVPSANGKIKLHFLQLRSLPVNDRRLIPQYFQSLHSKIAKAETVYLRLGLTRKWHPPRSPERRGYWIQVNGIYPDGHYAI